MTLKTFDGLPGFKLIEKGLTDLDHSIDSEEALLLLVARQRLQRVGIILKETVSPTVSPEHRLYMFLCSSYGDESGYYRYNSLLRTLNSFCEVMETRNLVKS